jgi:uncharacterized alpha-E superfamily protein
MNDELLSRMAGTLFWTGRYVERADDTARLVDVYVHRILSDPKTQEGPDCGPLFGLLGVETAGTERPDVGAALFRLAYDPKSPSAIAGAVLADLSSRWRSRAGRTQPGLPWTLTVAMPTVNVHDGVILPSERSEAHIRETAG